MKCGHDKLKGVVANLMNIVLAGTLFLAYT